MIIRDYLKHEARCITDHALSDLTDVDAWDRLIPERRRQYREMMGLTELHHYDSRRSPLNVQITGIVERPRYRIEKLYYESLPELYVTANLYIPTADEHGEPRHQPSPGVLYVCGHSDTQKVHYQSHARRFAELGFACLIVETVQLGEVRGYHHGCYREGWFHWISRGYSPASIETINGIRGLDLLVQRPDVDPEKLGVTGISGGGAVTWYVAAADERIKVAAPVCGTATLASHIAERTIDGHCDCMWWTNTYRWDLADIGALIAPRALLIASADRDELFTIASIREVHSQLQGLYGSLGATENLRLVETPGPHSYHERSRTAIFSWFVKHLQGRDLPPDQIGDVDESPGAQESEETLRVFCNGPLPEDRTPAIQEHLFTPPQPPEPSVTGLLSRAQSHVIAFLRRQTFAAFPGEPPPLDIQIEQKFASNGSDGFRFGFTSEEGWRLHGRARFDRAIALPAPCVIVLRSPGEARGGSERFVGKIRAPWVKGIVEPRGTGDTAWGDELNWHLRRAAAWTGRTLASMRVWDTLRAMESLRSLPEVDGDQISLAARGEMAAVALYAALLDGGIRTLFLESPPATQNAASSPDGRGEAIEMLNCLRITDLPYVAGLLYPTEIVIVGDRPSTYNWTEEMYRRLGPPGRISHVIDLQTWSPT